MRWGSDEKVPEDVARRLIEVHENATTTEDSNVRGRDERKCKAQEVECRLKLRETDPHKARTMVFVAEGLRHTII